MKASSQRIVVVSYGPTSLGARSGDDADAPVPTLRHELEMTRPALLYSDSVSLVSTMYQVNRDFFDAYGDIEDQPEKLVTVTETLFPPIALLTPGWDEVAALRDLAVHPNTPRRKRRKAQAELRKILAEFQAGQVFRMFDRQAFGLLEQAQADGVLSIEGLPGVDMASVGRMVGHLLVTLIRAALGGVVPPDSLDDLVKLARGATKRLIEVVEDAHSYPILDAGARSVLGSNRPPNDFSPSARARSRVGGLASHVMGHLPVLDYDLRDLAEIRASLSEQIGAFQLAIGELSTEISSAQWDLEFEKEVANLYQTRIVPRVNDLSAKLDDYRVHGKRRARRKAATGAASGGLNVFVGVAATANLVQDWVDATLVALAGLPPALAFVGAKLVRDVQEEINAELRQLQSNRFYYLAAAEEQLAAWPGDGRRGQA